MTVQTDTDLEWMAHALDEARLAWKAGEVPVGTVIVRDGAIVARTHNRTICDQDASAHAELLAIRESSAAMKSWRLTGCTLYVTLEPCAMCSGAIVLARVDRVVFAAWDPKAGMAGSIVDLLRHPRLNHRPQVQGGVREAEASSLLREFFAARRAMRFVDTPPSAG